MHRSASISTAIIILSAFMLQGCIHTYPDGSGEDPTLITAALEIDLGKEWTEKKIIFGDKSRSAQSPLVRTTLSVTRKGTTISQSENIISQDKIENGTLLLPIPATLLAQSYNICVWCDYVDPMTHTPHGYDISSISDIKPLFNHGNFLSHQGCRSYSGSMDLSKYQGEWDVKAVIPVSMGFPTGGFRIVAEDYTDFREMFSRELENGESFSVVVEYANDIPSSFNLTEDVPTRPTANVSFSRDLDYIIFPVSELEIASDRLFVTKEPMEVTLRITVFNSAKAIVARTPEVSFPIEQGMTTTVTGKFLTDFISGGITVDTKWDGEITIDIDDPPDN